jgi:4-hydroxybenzoate polyprenyltransferase
MRPQQWVKNIVVFGALVFAREFTRPAQIGLSLLAFAVFCTLSSAIYVFNDIADREQDRIHPGKRDRPVASGRVSVTQGYLLAAVLAAIGIGCSSLLPERFVLLGLAFLFLNVLYSTVLKKVVIIDVMAVAASFVIRAAAGSAAIGVPNSSWLIACTFLLALFLGFGKRRHEIVTLRDSAVSHRATLKNYSVYFLDQLIGVVTASTVVAYTFYTVSPEVSDKLEARHLELTIPFVIYGIFRYLYLIHQEERGGSPTKLLISDGPILVNILLWFCCTIGILLFLGD